MGKLAAPVDAPHPFKAELITAIRWANNNTDRSLQKFIGPSEVGTPCLRELGNKLAGTEPCNDPDPWFAIIGTSVHDWLAFSLDQYQREVLGRTGENRRWLIENRVDISHDKFGTSGSTDLYDVDEQRVVDYKVVGNKSLTKYRVHGPTPTYKVQTHTYGKGWRQRGFPVREVALVFLPRSNFLSFTHIWSEPFDESVADAALDRVGVVRDLLAAGISPNALPMASSDPGHCTWCDYRSPVQGVGCPGVDT